MELLERDVSSEVVETVMSIAKDILGESVVSLISNYATKDGHLFES